MKRIIFTIVFTIAVNGIIAQPWMMKIKQGSGTTYSDASTVDDITFVNTTTTPFVCGDVILYGGETYPTILIGSQCWFQKNLNIGARIDGSQQSTNNSIIEKYCYNDNNTNCTTFGGLYQWDEAMQYSTTSGSQGICPEGWHIPTNAEFQTLGTSVGGDGNALKAEKEGSETEDGKGTNTSGFSALVAGLGMYFSNGSEIIVYGNIGMHTYWWISQETGTGTEAWNIRIIDLNSFILELYHTKKHGASIRCLKN